MFKKEDYTYQELEFSDLTADQLYEILYLRAKVFVVEQESPCLDPDYMDQSCIHCLLYKDDHLVAYARVLPAGLQHEDVGIGRVVTTERGNGTGAFIFRRAMDVATKTFGAKRIEITAQLWVKQFYEKFGFKVTSEPFELEFRPHVTMLWEAKPSE